MKILQMFKGLNLKIKQFFCLHESQSTLTELYDCYYASETTCNKCGKRMPFHNTSEVRRELMLQWELKQLLKKQKDD